MTGHGRDVLTLTMIVKDEAKTLARTLATVRPFIDRWVILDTGSTDGTQDLVRREMANVPGELFEEPFVDFSTSRNRALDLAGEATDFVMWLDADDELENGRLLRDFLERERAHPGKDREAYYLRVQMGIAWDSPRVFRARARWRFRGVVHEILTHPDRPPPSMRVPDVFIYHRPGTGSAERTRARWERDVALLRSELERDPSDTRSAFYLAETLLWLQRWEEAEAAFHHRITLGGWSEEIFESKQGLARAAAGAGLPWGEIEVRWLDAHTFSPHRAEPLHAIALHYDGEGKAPLTYLFARRAFELPLPLRDSLFVDEEVYTWKAADLCAASAFWVGEFQVGEAAARKAVQNHPGDERLQRNLEHYLDRKRKLKGRR